MHAAYETSTPVVYTGFIEVFSLIFGFSEFRFFLSVWVRSFFLSINVCLVIFVIIGNIRL